MADAKHTPIQPHEWSAWEVVPHRSFHGADTIRAQYRRLASIHHPDKGGDATTMARINAAYAKALP